MRSDLSKSLLALLGIFFILYVAPLSLRPPTAPDEYRYGEVAREMLASGDWIVPRLDGMPYFEKPAMGYWLIAISIAGFGESAFAMRFPSALAAGGTAIILLPLLRRLGADRRVAMLAGWAYLTALLPFAIGVTAVLDSIFTFFVTATMAAAWPALHEDESAQRRWWLAGMGVASGCAVLTKGPLGWVLPAIALVPYLLLTGRTRRFLREAWLPASVSAAVVAPWSIAIHLRSEFWHRFLWVEHFQRFRDAGADQHPAAFWYYAVYLIPATLPWILLLPTAVIGAWRSRRGSSGDSILFLACWIALPFLLFTAASGKLLPYILPCVPPFIALLILGATGGADRPPKRGVRLASAISAALGALLLLALALGSWHGESALHALGAGRVASALLLLGGAAWMASGVAGLMARDGLAALRWMAVAPMLLMLALQSITGGGPMHGSPDDLFRRGLERAGPDAVLVGDNSTAQALCWLSRREDIEVFGPAFELQYGLDRTPGRGSLDPDALRSLLKRSELPVVLAVLTEKREHYRRGLPDPRREEIYHRFAFLEFAPHSEREPRTNGAGEPDGARP